MGTRPARRDAPRRLLAGVVRPWRSSLRFRVVSTILVGLLVTMLLQGFLYQRIATGLVESRVDTVREDAAQRARQMQSRLDGTDQVDAESIRQLTYDLVRQQESTDPDRPRDVILTRSLTNAQGPEHVPTMSIDVGVEAVPPELRQAVTTDPIHQQLQVATVPRGDAQVPAVFVGSQLRVPLAGPMELYFVYPLDRERDVASMILRTFVLGAVVLVVLIGLVAIVVAKLVVDPVREAAEIAGRLSSGRLNERMAVRGNDDLTTLARSFNDMADNLQRQIQQLEDLSRVQQRFVSDVSHELRTPLTTIRMATEVIHSSREDFPPLVARSAELLADQVDRFEVLLSQLLEISRFDSGVAVLDRERHDLRDVVARVVDGCAPLAANKGSEVIVTGAQEPVLADMDHRRVERIVRNLLVNALEHGEGRPVRVELGANDSAVGVAVRDHGSGLGPGQAGLVFNRFWRADPSRKRTTGGTGLGLAIALEDARLHQGWLQAWGRPGAGARFRLTLPRTADRPIVHAPLPLHQEDPFLAEASGGTLPRADAAAAPAPTPPGAPPAPRPPETPSLPQPPGAGAPTPGSLPPGAAP